MRIIKLFYLASLLTITLSFSQTRGKREEIKKTNNQNELEKIKIKQEANFEIAEKRIKAYLIRNPNVKRTQINNGKIFYIKNIDNNGSPIYITTKKKQDTENAK